MSDNNTERCYICTLHHFHNMLPTPKPTVTVYIYKVGNFPALKKLMVKETLLELENKEIVDYKHRFFKGTETVSKSCLNVKYFQNH